MATVYITEFEGIGSPGGQTVQAGRVPPVTEQTVAIGASSAQSAAFNSATGMIRVHADATCSIALGGTNPTATAANARFAAGQPEYFIVKPGDKLAVITNT